MELGELLEELLVFEFDGLDGGFGVFQKLKFLLFAVFELELDAFAVESELLFDLG